MEVSIFTLPIILCTLINGVCGKIHQFEIKGDTRGYFPISTFGFYENGYLDVKVSNFSLMFHNESDDNSKQNVGFILEKTTNTFVEQQTHKCPLNSKPFNPNDTTIQQIYFIFDLQNKRVNLQCDSFMADLLIFNNTKEVHQHQERVTSKKLSSGTSPKIIKEKAHDATIGNGKSAMKKDPFPGKKCSNTQLKMVQTGEGYSFRFVSLVSQEKQEGQYRLSFYNCHNYVPNPETTINIALEVEEQNPDENYLSAGEIPLPALYFMMSLLFMLSASFWFFILKKSKNPVFKIHYLMGILVVIKSLSLLFHGVNYHFIQVYGKQIKTWAVMYYIMHLLKGALLFTVLALIGSGWAFIKHVLSTKEKRIFAIVIPLQVIANLATIIIDETEESNSDRDLWTQLLFLIDFLCCGAILLPVVWSIRHLQEASQTSGKAAINLKKLKLFRHFYVMIICYIYFTRIIVYLLRLTVPFQYMWMDDMCHEMATYVFFVVIGYKFRPETNNPYFRVEETEDLDEVLTTTGLTAGLTKVNQKNREVLNRYDLDPDGEEEEINLLQGKESSHEFD